MRRPYLYDLHLSQISCVNARLPPIPQSGQSVVPDEPVSLTKSEILFFHAGGPRRERRPERRLIERSRAVGGIAGRAGRSRTYRNNLKPGQTRFQVFPPTGNNVLVQQHHHPRFGGSATYSPTLTKEERRAFDWVGDRYNCGKVAGLLLDCIPEARPGSDDGDITFTIPEHVASEDGDETIGRET